MPTIFDNITTPFLENDQGNGLRDALKLAIRGDFCVGYFNLRGWRSIDDVLEGWPQADSPTCRLLVGMTISPDEELRLLLASGSDQTRLDNATVVKLKNRMAADFKLRQKVTAQLSFFVYQLFAPRLDTKDAAFRPLVERAARLVGTSGAYDELLKEVFGKKATHQTHGLTDPAARQTTRAEIDALVAHLYDLTEDEFTHILSTFPLVDESVKSETRNTYRELLRSGKLPA